MAGWAWLRVGAGEGPEMSSPMGIPQFALMLCRRWCFCRVSPPRAFALAALLQVPWISMSQMSP